MSLYRERAWTADKGENVKVNIGYSTTGHKNVHLNYFRLQMKREDGMCLYGFLNRQDLRMCKQLISVKVKSQNSAVSTAKR